MCGIFGFLINEDIHLSAPALMKVVNHMFKLSESRGKEASGVAIRVNGSIYVFKEPVSASKLIKSEQYTKLFKDVIKRDAYANGHLNSPLVVLCYP